MPGSIKAHIRLRLLGSTVASGMAHTLAPLGEDRMAKGLVPAAGRLVLKDEKRQKTWALGDLAGAINPNEHKCGHHPS